MVAFRETLIRIVSVPPGEAPESIREQWVGLVLPLAAGHSGPVQMPTCGVVSGETEVTIGYVVDLDEAIAALARKSPTAAQWWKTHAAHLFREDGQLVFHADACELVFDAG